MQEFIQLSQLASQVAMFSGAGLLWLQIVFLILTFVVFLLRPERIRSHALLKWSWILFALSVVAPAVLFAIVTSMELNAGLTSRPGRMSFTTSPWQSLIGASGSMLFGLSMIVGFLSLSAEPRPVRQPPVAQPHPLD